MQLVIAEKPSVARDLARVLGVPARGKGAFRGPHHVVTWCIGHLVELEEPATYDPAWKRWRLETLPMLPASFRLRPTRGTLAQWRVVRDLLRSSEFDGVINACDAGREGELIFRWCCELAGARPRPVRRLWVSALTDAALRAGFAALRPSASLDPLADAARCRAQADWLVGMNATRGLTARAGRARLLSVGRVQTPTLALVVARDVAIETFVPQAYAELHGDFRTAGGAAFSAIFTAGGKTRLAPPIAAQLAERDRPAPARVAGVERTVERVPPPLLFDLTSLQRAASARHGLSARRTLEAAQKLYERHKLLTYPRTESQHLPETVRGELPGILTALQALPPVAAFARSATVGRLPRVFNDRKVGEHHALIPTSHAPSAALIARLSDDERRVHELVVRRFLAALHPDAELARTVVTVRVAAQGPPVEPAPPDLFVARGQERLVAGWQDVAGVTPKTEILPALSVGEAVSGRYRIEQKVTEPPPRLTDGSLLAAMESAGKEIADEELRAAMRDGGLGTPATRAATIETLLERGFLAREGKWLRATPVGRALIETIPEPSLASPELTGRWEARLARMARGEEGPAAFMADIATYVRGFVDAIRAAPAAATGAVAAVVSDAPPVGTCPLCGGAVVETFKTFKCGGCKLQIWKRVAGRKISATLAAVLLRARRTQVLPGFRSKAGKRFRAMLVLDENGEVRFDFGDGVAPRAPRPEPPPRAPRRRKVAAPPQGARCPKCGAGAILTGNRAWGCSRWKDGCKLVVPFEPSGRPLTAAQLRALLEKGVTRATRDGRLRLDLDADPPVVRVEPPGQAPV